jgi:arginyl-tRNA synthetase
MREYLKEFVRKALDVQAEKYGYKLVRVNFSFEPPPRAELGDYSTNAAILLAKQAGVEPVKVADEMRSALISIKDVFEEIEVAGGGFLNFKLSRDFVIQEFARFDPERFNRGKKETILIEYSSPNIGKPLSIAHIRSTIIGDSLARIHRWLGYRVITDNHLGDWGLQAGMLVAAYRLWGAKPIVKMTMSELLELYVRFNSEMKENDELASRARLETVLLQKEERKTLALWNEIRKKSIAEFNRLYKILDVKFDHTLGESAYRKDFARVVTDAQKTGVAQESQGAIVIPFEPEEPLGVSRAEPPLIIQKQDGGYLYATFDLATIRWRIKRWKPDKILYVVSNEQTQYFDQMFRAAEKLGWLAAHSTSSGQAHSTSSGQACELVHVKFGLLRGEDLKRLSTRKGEIIMLDKVIDEAVQKAREIVEKKNTDLHLKEKDKIAEAVGIGALKYNDLSQNRNTDIIFDWNRMLDFDGNSAPYIQYTYARLRSIARKARNSKLEIRNEFKLSNFLKQPEEVSLMKKALQLPEAAEDAARELAPNFVANYLWEMTNLVNVFYEKYPVLKAEKNVRDARLFLISKVAGALKQGLLMLGIKAPEQV